MKPWRNIPGKIRTYSNNPPRRSCSWGLEDIPPWIRAGRSAEPSPAPVFFRRHCAAKRTGMAASPYIVLTDHHAPLPGSRNVRAIQCDGVQPFCNRRFRACGRQCAVADIERAWPVRHIDRKAGLETLLDRTASLQTRAAIHGMECLLMTRRVSR